MNIIPSHVDDISIYYHIPFCKRRCSYCDFEIVNTTSNYLIKKYIDILISQSYYYKNFLKKDSVKSLYFGGGTPSVLSIKDLEFLLYNIIKILDISDSIEITIELNPEDITEDLMRMLKNYTNRISVGFQSFCDTTLKKLGRINNKSQNHKALDISTKYFSNISGDILVSFQKDDALFYDIKTLSCLPHISAYSLILEPASRLSELKTKEVDDYKFLLLEEELVKNSYENYEVSSFCKNKTYSNHNLRYWNMGYYVGIGVGACGFLPVLMEGNINLIRYKNDNFFRYMKNISDNKKSFEYEIIDEKTFLKDSVLTGLRTIFGIAKSNLKENEIKILDFFKKYFKNTKNSYILLDRYFLFQDSIIQEIFEKIDNEY